MKVNLKKSVVGLDGQEIQQTNLGQILANNLASESNPNHQKITY